MSGKFNRFNTLKTKVVAAVALPLAALSLNACSSVDATPIGTHSETPATAPVTPGQTDPTDIPSQIDGVDGTDPYATPSQGGVDTEPNANDVQCGDIYTTTDPTCLIAGLGYTGIHDLGGPLYQISDNSVIGFCPQNDGANDPDKPVSLAVAWNDAVNAWAFETHYSAGPGDGANSKDVDYIAKYATCK